MKKKVLSMGAPKIAVTKTAKKVSKSKSRSNVEYAYQDDEDRMPVPPRKRS